MKLVRAKHFLVTVAAIFSLFVSAVSACACTHHESVKVETGSCHSSSHEASAAAEQPNRSDQVDGGCNCYVRTPVPAIVAKKDDKRTVVEQQLAGVLELSVTIDFKFNRAELSALPVQPLQSNYKHALLASLPSRAPPRL